MYRKLMLLNTILFTLYYIINYVEFYDMNKKNIFFQLVNTTKGLSLVII